MAADEKGSTSDEFILVEWSINKVYTVLQNNKKVNLNELVTCKVNNTKDIGKIVYVGNESECNNVLETYRIKKNKKKKKSHRHKSHHRSKLNLPIAPNRPSMNSSTINLYKQDGLNNDDYHHKVKMTLKVNPKYRSIENELNTLSCDNEVASIIDESASSQLHRQRRNQRNEFRSIANHQVFINKQQSIDSAVTIATNTNVCHECECCKTWQREVQSLRNRLKLFDAVFAYTPDVIAWFDTLKLTTAAACAPSAKSSISDSFSSLSTLSLGGGVDANITTSTTTTDVTPKLNEQPNNKTTVVPEIVIENVV